MFKVLAALLLISLPAIAAANTPPEITTTVGPTPLYDSEDATCTVYYSDPEGDVGRIEVNWSVSASQVAMREFDNIQNDTVIKSNLNSTNYDVGQQLLCNATAYDKDGDGDSTWNADNLIVDTFDPEVTDGPNFANYSTKHAFNVSAVVLDREGQDELSWCRLNATDGEGNQILDNMSMIKSYGDKDQVRCFYPNISNYTSGFEVVEDINVSVWVNDSGGGEGNASAINAIPNSPPVIYNVNPKDDSSTASSDVMLEANVMDDDGEMINVSFYNDSGASPERLHFEADIVSGGYTSETWNDLQSLKTFRWYVNATDGHQTVIKQLRFRNLVSSQYRAHTEFGYRYSTVVISPNKSKTVPFTVKNTAGDIKNLRTVVSGANAEFVSNGLSVKNYDLESGESVQFRIRVSPDTAGRTYLTATTENENFEITIEDRMEVYVRSPTATAAEVPGLGLIQLVFLLVSASTLFYSGRL